MADKYVYTISKELFNDNGYRIMSADVPFQPGMDKLDIDPQWHTVTIGGNGLDDLEVGKMYTSELTEDGVPKPGYHQLYFPSHFEYDYPETAADQWKYLRFLLNGKNSKAFRSLQDNYTSDTKILDVFLNGEFPKAGIKEVREKRYRKIIDQITQLKTISQFVAGFPASEDLTTGTLFKLATLYHDPKRSAKILKKNPYMSMTLKGFGFLKAEGLRQKLQDQKVKTMADDDPVRIGQGVAYFLDDWFSNGSTYATTKQVIGLSDQLGIDSQIVHDYLQQEEINSAIIRKSRIRVTFGLNSPLYIDLAGDRISTTHLAKAEFLIYKTMVKNNTQNPNGILRPQKVWEKIINDTIDGTPVTDEQRQAFENLNKYQFSILSGPAGTGKSWVTARIVEAMKRAGVDYTLTASTAKASKVLAGYTHDLVTTVHRAIKYGQHKSKVIESKVLIVDEASMIGSELLAEIIVALKSDTSLLLVGDSAQLPSVSPGNILRDLISGGIGTTLLTKVFRQANDDGLKKELNLSRVQKFELPSGYTDMKYHAYGKDLFFRYFEDDNALADHVLWLYQELILKKKQPIDELLVMTPMHKGSAGVDNLNKRLRQIANPHADQRKAFDVNDRIMVTKNTTAYPVEDNELKVPHGKDESDDDMISIYNGDTGVVSYRSEDALVIRLDDGDIVGIDPTKMSQMRNLEYGYAVTYHKAQGSSAKNVMMVVPGGAAYMLNSNLIYTGLSRAVDRAYVLGRLNLLPLGIKKTADDVRCTLLADKIESSHYEF